MCCVHSALETTTLEDHGIKKIQNVRFSALNVKWYVV